jgi:hypothetical protein
MVSVVVVPDASTANAGVLPSCGNVLTFTRPIGVARPLLASADIVEAMSPTIHSCSELCCHETGRT